MDGFMPKKGGAPGNFENMDDVNRFINKVVKELTSGCANMPNPTGPIVYSFNVRIDPANTTPLPAPQAEPKYDKEPLIDIIDRSKQISVLAELQGLDRNSIGIFASNSKLRITSPKHDSAYGKSVILPDSVDPSSAVAKYNNGVLEVTFNKSVRMSEEVRIALS